MQVRPLIGVCVCCLSALPCPAQTAPAVVLSPQSIEAQLKGPIVMLRGMYDGRTLKFDALGNLIGKSREMPFCLSAVRVHKVRVDDSGVRIDAEREGLEFSYGKQRSVREQGWGVEVRIEIALDPGHPEELKSALAKVFSVGLDQQLADAVPAYWRPWLLNQLDPSVDVEAAGPNTINLAEDWEKPKLENVTPPRMEPSILVMPQEPPVAQQENYGGVPILGLVVDTSGKPTKIRIVQPVGMGLDEAAVKAASGLKFKPARYQGKPVAVYIVLAVPIFADRRQEYPHPGTGQFF